MWWCGVLVGGSSSLNDAQYLPRTYPQDDLVKQVDALTVRTSSCRSAVVA